MIHDLSAAPGPARPEYDICIIGTGPAGMTVARELSGTGRTICVLESGKLKTTAFADSLRRVEWDGMKIKEYSRERVFGGASTTWAGLSSPLDPIDFEPRPWLQQSGWPISRDELLPYYREAGERYRFAQLDLFGDAGFCSLRNKSALQPAWRDLDEKVFLAAASPQNFGREHRAIFDIEGVDLYLDASVVALRGSGREGRIERAEVRTSTGATHGFSAGIFVVATGGIENARLLLNSRDLCGEGTGNEFDQVGRYFMNHPKNYHGWLNLNKTVAEAPYYFGCIYHDFSGYAGLRLPEPVQRSKKVLNSYVRFEPMFPWSGSTGVESLVTIVKKTKFLLKGFQARRRGKVITLRDYSETGDDSDLQNERKTAAGWASLAWNVAADSPRVAKYAYYRLFENVKPSIRRVRLRNFLEMEPDPANRVTLSAEKDPLGMPVPHISNRCTELDRRSLIELHNSLRDEFQQSGIGTLESNISNLDPWPIDQDASHHIGTTRMGRDPRASVVDAHQRVHSVKNLYMAGASVFPTSGCANPTFTIVALSIRLARRLAGAGSPSGGSTPAST